jgi:hypothetical protein
MSRPEKNRPFSPPGETGKKETKEEFENLEDYDDEDDDDFRHRLKKSGKRFHRRPRRDKEYLDE